VLVGIAAIVLDSFRATTSPTARVVAITGRGAASKLPIAVGGADCKSGIMALTSFAERAFYFFGLGLARLVYHVTTTRRQTLPAGGFLLLPKHITWIDAIVLQLACLRPIRFIIHEEYYRNSFLNPFLRTVGCIPITSSRAKDAMRDAAERVRAGEIVCLFPEGQLSRSGTLLRIWRGYKSIARRAEAPVVPVWLDQLRGSIFCFQGGRFFTKWPRRDLGLGAP
jgi:acyl-[acyl-carrier-protein]-phospholipid O-acyltransferase/long-chain-fatty-acid--[acyl-carrier-protein] ligase